MKKIISLVVLMALVLSLVLMAASCGKDSEEPLDIEFNPEKNPDKGGSDIEDPEDLTNPDIGNDGENTWNEDGNAIGPPVKLPPM